MVDFKLKVRLLHVQHMTEVTGDYTGYLKKFNKRIDEIEFDNSDK